MKKALLGFSFLGLLFTLAACGGGEADTTAPVFTGVEDSTILRDEAFDALEGISATDEVDGDVTANIEVSGTVDVGTVGTYFLRYSVSDEAGNTREETRYITVDVDTSSLGDEMVPNGNFDLGWAVWNATTGLEGGMAEYAVNDGVLEIDIQSVASAMWEPRLENTGISFENGETYEVSFEAWAEAPRAIHVQVGEILDDAPYFENFKPGQVTIFDIGTEKDTYSFKFTMGLDTNENGSLLFEMGTVPSDALGTDNVVTTVYMDNVNIEEAEADPDTDGPVLDGIRESVTLAVGSSFDPLAGVSGYDVTDGDVTEDISVIITDEAGDEVTLDTDVAGTYTVTYRSEDSLGNVSEETSSLVISSFTYTATDKIVNGDFSGDDLSPWTNYIDGAADASVTLVDGAAEIDVVEGGTANWNIQFIHGSVALEEGVTYQLSFDAKASEARDINAVFYNADTQINYLLSGPVSLGTEMATYEYMFTMTADIAADLQFLLGTNDNFAAGTVTIDNVVLSTMDQDPVVENSAFELLENTTGDAPLNWEWFTEADGQGTATVEASTLTVDVTGLGEQAYQPHLFQMIGDLDAGTYNVKLVLNSAVDRDLRFNLILPDGGYASLLEGDKYDFSVTAGEETVVAINFTLENPVTNVKLELDFGTLGDDLVSAVGSVDIEEILVYRNFGTGE